MSEVKLALGFEGNRVEKTIDVARDEPRPYDLDTKLEVVGKPHARLDGLAKACGRARYTHDVRLPGMLWGAILRSPHAAANVRSVDLEKARAMPGVKAVLRIARDRVFYHGDEIAAVAATSLDLAREALRAIDVRYEVLPHVVDATEARGDKAPRVFDRRANVQGGRDQNRGDPAAALAAADKVVKATYRTQVQTHLPLETHGVVAHFEDDGSLTVYASTQGTFATREQLRLASFELRMRVVAEHVGGGFGSKFNPGPEGTAAVKLAREAKAPVWMMVDRKGCHLACGNRPDSVQYMEGGIEKDGKITVLTVRAYGTGGVGGGAGVANPMIYAVPTVLKREESVFTNAGGARAFRAPGHPQGSFALEMMVDELADAIGMDPLEVRILNDPSPIRQQEWRIGAEAIGWKEKRNRTPGKAPGGGPGTVLRGVGCAGTKWGGHGGPGAAVLVRIDDDGTVEARNGAQDIGTGTRTVIACCVAEELGLAGPGDVRVHLGDTRDPVGPASGGSVTAPSIAPAARAGAFAVKQSLWKALRERLPGQPESPDGRFRGGKVRLARDGKEAWVPFAEAVALSGKKGLQAVGERERNFRDVGFHESGVAGCQFAEVEVDVETGQVRVLKVVAVQDMGTIIDKLTAESQVIGGVIQGVGYALLEERIMDKRSGRMLNADMLYYKIPSAGDCPEIVPILFPVASGMNSVGLLGLGEPPTIPTAGAIANAVANATGVRVRELPLTPDRVLAALREQRPEKKEGWR